MSATSLSPNSSWSAGSPAAAAMSSSAASCRFTCFTAPRSPATVMPSGISGYKSVDQQMQEWPDKLRKPVSFEKQCKEWPDKLRNSTSPRKMRSTSPPTRTPQPPDFTGDELTGAGSGKVPSPQTGEAWSEGASRLEVPSRSPRRATGVTPGQR